jgi:hypothetical protein
MRSSGKHPMRSTGEHPMRSVGEHPIRSTGEHPMRSTGEHPMRSVGEHPMRSTGEHPMRSVGEHPMRSVGGEGKYQICAIANGMLETGKDTVVDALAKLEPRPKPLSEQRAAIEANREAIYAAKDRGCSWVQIAAACAEAGLVVSPDALRFAINAVPRDFKKHPRRSIAQKRRGRQPSVSRGTIQAGNTDEERDGDRTRGCKL